MCIYIYITYIIYHLYIHIYIYVYGHVNTHTSYIIYIYIHTCSRHGVLSVLQRFTSHETPMFQHGNDGDLFRVFHDRPRQARAIATVKLDDEQFSQLDFFELPWGFHQSHCESYSFDLQKLPQWFQIATDSD